MTFKAAALFFSLALLAPQSWSAPARADTAFSAAELAPHLLLVKGPSGNTLVAEDADGLILVEGVPAEHAAAYLDFVRTETGQPRIKALIHTHWHPDSAGLNAVLGEQGVPIIAHEYTRQWLGATIRKRGAEILHRPVAAAALPTETFHGTAGMPFRGGRIEYGHLLQAHTDGDIYVRFPGQNVLYTGPAVRSDAWATVHEPTNGFIGGLLDAYTTLAGLIDDATIVVPASGPILDKSGFEEQQALYRGLMDEMVRLLRESKSAAEVVALNPAAGLRPDWGDPAEFLDQGFRSFYGHLRETRHVGSMP